MSKLTKAQKRVLTDLAEGGCFFAALRRSSDYAVDGILFSESVGIVVHKFGSLMEERYRVRNATVAPLYEQTPCLVIDEHQGNNGGGWRSYVITEAGRTALKGDEQ